MRLVFRIVNKKTQPEFGKADSRMYTSNDISGADSTEVLLLCTTGPRFSGQYTPGPSGLGTAVQEGLLVRLQAGPITVHWPLEIRRESSSSQSAECGSAGKWLPARSGVPTCTRRDLHVIVLSNQQ